MASATRRLFISAVVAGALLATLLPGIAVAATRPTTFDLYTRGNCISGRASDRVTMRVVWRSASGTLKMREDIRTSGNGYWELCASESTRVVVGDSIKATIGGNSRTFVVPNITLTMNRVTDYFKGRAPAGATVVLSYQQGVFGDTEASKTIRAGSDGRWQYRKAGYDIIGGQYASLRWQSTQGDAVTVDRVAPYLIVTLGKPRFSGATNATGSKVAITLLNATTGAVRATGSATSNQDSAFSGKFRNSAGNAVNAAAGNRLTAPSLAGDADWIIPNIQGSANAATEVVSGRCFDAGTGDRSFWVRVLDGTGDFRGQALGTTDSAGRFEINFADPASSDGVIWWDAADVRSGDVILIRCLQTTGDWVHREITAP